MTNIIRIPVEAKKFFNIFKGILSHACLILLMYYVFGLIIVWKGKRNIQGITSIFMSGPSRSNMVRLFTDYKWDYRKALEVAVMKIMSMVPFRVGKRIILIIDDTKIEKTGRKMEGVGSIKRNDGSYCIGHCKVSMTVYYNGISFPVDLRLYVPKKACKAIECEFKTKNQIAAEMIRAFNPPAGMKAMVLFDCWYLNPTVLKAVKEKGFHYVSYLRCNRNIKRDGKKIKVSKYALDVGYQQVCYIPRGLNTKPECHQAIVEIPSLGVTKLVISRTNEKSKELTYKFLVTDIRSMPMIEILKLYDLRWEIECEYRSSKQCVGMGEYQMRKIEAIVRHLYSATISLLLLVYLNLEEQRRKNHRSFDNYAETVRFLNALVMANTVKWIVRQVKKGCNVTGIIKNLEVNYG